MAAKRYTPAVYKRDGSPYYWTKFVISKKRYQLSTETTVEREAEEIAGDFYAAKTKERAAELAGTSKIDDGPLTLKRAWERWWDEASEGTKNRDDLDTDMTRIMTEFRKDGRLILPATKLLTSVTHDDVKALREWRRDHYRWGRKECGLVSNRTVNQSIEIIRRLFTRGKENWGVAFNPVTAPRWDELLLELPKERVRILSTKENEALNDEIPPAYADVFDYALVSGLRLENCLLEWKNLDLENNLLDIKGKGGKVLRRQLTAAERKIIDRKVGHHDVYVFTFVAKVTRKGKIKGKRYPITYDGMKTEWRRARGRAVLKAPSLVSDDLSKSFRWHDTRHTFGTTLFKSTKNVKMVQRALNHSNVNTTMKYVHVMDDELASGMDAAHDAMEAKYGKRNTETSTHKVVRVTAKRKAAS